MVGSTDTRNRVARPKAWPVSVGKRKFRCLVGLGREKVKEKKGLVRPPVDIGRDAGCCKLGRTVLGCDLVLPAPCYLCFYFFS